MKLLENIYQNTLEKGKGVLYRKSHEECEKLCEILSDRLGAGERRSLMDLADKYTFLVNHAHEQGFKDGFSAAWKMIFSLIE